MLWATSSQFTIRLLPHKIQTLVLGCYACRRDLIDHELSNRSYDQHLEELLLPCTRIVEVLVTTVILKLKNLYAYMLLHTVAVFVTMLSHYNMRRND